MTPTPTSLVLEFSQRTGSVAMVNGAGCRATKNIETDRRGADDVFPTINNLANELSISPSTLELVVVSVGPGGFTGLRTAVAITKMISLSTGAKVVAVESALSIVRGETNKDGTYLVVSGIKQESFWLSRVVVQKEEWKSKSALSSIAEFGNLQFATTNGVFADNCAPPSLKDVCSKEGVEFFDSKPTAFGLLEIGLAKFKQGATTDPLCLLPVYPREPEAVRLWNEKKKT